MRRNVSVAVALAVLLACVAFARAEDKADSVTLKGTLACAKCVFKEADSCQNVLRVKDGDKTTDYYLVDNDETKDTHKKVCKKAAEDVSVTGTVEEKDGKKWITATKIEGLS